MPPEDPIPTDADIAALREEPRPEFLAALDARMAGALAGARLEEERRQQRARRRPILRLPRLARPALAGAGAAAVAVAVALAVVTGGEDDPTLTARVEAAGGKGAAAPSVSGFDSKGAGEDAARAGLASTLKVLPSDGKVVRLRFRAVADGPLDIVLTGAGGEPVLRRSGVALPAGEGVVTLTVADAPAGSYALRATSRTPVERRLTATVRIP